MIPWYYALATFYLGGCVMLIVCGVCTASSAASRAEEQRELSRWEFVETYRNRGHKATHQPLILYPGDTITVYKTRI